MEPETTPGTGTSDLDTGTQGTPGGEGEGEEVAKLRADNTRLRQKNAENEQMMTRAVPLVRIAQTLIAAPGGKEIVEKLNKGEPLTVAEQKQVQETQQKLTPETPKGDAPLTRVEAEKLFQGLLDEAVGKMGETVAAERKAADNLTLLEARGEKELEGFGNLKQDPQYKRQVNDIIEQIRDGTIEVPEKEPDMWWFAMKTAHTVLHAMRGTPVKGKKADSERVAEALKAGGAGPSSRTQTDESDIPGELKDTIGKIRQLGSRTIAGKSFGNPKMNR